MFKNELYNSSVKIGTWAEIPTPYASNIIARAGIDFQIIDMEHGVIDFELAQNMIFAIKSEKKYSMIRVPCIDEAYTLRALDTGVDGIIFPGVKNVGDVNKIIDYTKYPNIGKKGFNPYISAGGYNRVNSEFFNNENKRTVIGIIIEGKEAFENIEEVVNNDWVDIVYIGQYDLSVALGVPGDINNKLVLEALEYALKIINKHNKVAGCMVHSIEEAQLFIKKGCGVIVYKVDSGVLFGAYNSFISNLKK